MWILFCLRMQVYFVRLLGEKTANNGGMVLPLTSSTPIQLLRIWLEKYVEPARTKFPNQSGAAQGTIWIDPQTGKRISDTVIRKAVCSIVIKSKFGR